MQLNEFLKFIDLHISHLAQRGGVNMELQFAFMSQSSSTSSFLCKYVTSKDFSNATVLSNISPKAVTGSM